MFVQLNIGFFDTFLRARRVAWSGPHTQLDACPATNPMTGLET